MKDFRALLWAREGRQTADFRRPGTRPCSMDVILEKVAVGWRKPRVILDLWSGQGHLSSYLPLKVTKIPVVFSLNS